MARAKCRCGAEVLWKADEPQSDKWLLIAKADMAEDPAAFFASASAGAFCRSSGRLWVAWDDGVPLAEYVPADPEIRPVRQPDRKA